MDFDPARISNQLKRYAPTAQIRTSYLEAAYYGKRFGFLFVHGGRDLVVFDKSAHDKGEEGLVQGRCCLSMELSMNSLPRVPL